MSYFRNLEKESESSFDFAEDLGLASDRAQGVLELVADALSKGSPGSNDPLFSAVHAVLRELSDMRRSIDVFIDAHPELATNSNSPDSTNNRGRT